jgi:DNA polymerase IV
VGAENTFSADLAEFDDMREALKPIVEKVWRHCDSAGASGRTVVIKVKYADFRQITRRRTIAQPVASAPELERIAVELLSALMPVPKPVRLLGVTVSSLNTEPVKDSPQLRLALLDR